MAHKVEKGNAKQTKYQKSSITMLAGMGPVDVIQASQIGFGLRTHAR